MATWNSRGLRGSALEEFINFSNETYRDKGLALVQKIPTPIKPLKIDKSTSTITQAYFEKDSTVDYIGVCQGVPICFDAKECAANAFSFQNVHEHQFNFMREFEAQDGVSFLIINFTAKNKFYYMRFRELESFYNSIEAGLHPKNVLFDELDESYFIPSEKGVIVHYLECLKKDLIGRENRDGR